MSSGTDIRTILLCKTKPSSDTCWQGVFHAPAPEHEEYHTTHDNYNALIFTKTISLQSGSNNESFLSDILNEKKALSNYYADDENNPFRFFHPLHVIKQTNNIELITDFWSEKLPFCAISIIYSNIDKNNIHIRDNELELSNAIGGKGNFCDLGDGTSRQPAFCIYRSINLSELIIIWKAADLKYILEKINDLKSYITTMYTICGYCENSLSDNEKKLICTLNEQNPSISCLDDNTKKMLNKTQSIITKDYREEKWAFPIVETINLLKDMCSNPYLKRIKYFIADSLFVFGKALKDIATLNDKNIILLHNKDVIFDFASNLNRFINRLIRADGYLAQASGSSSLINSVIPVGVLGGYYSFVYSLMSALNNINDEQNNAECRYALLMFPVLTDRIKIDDVLQRITIGHKPIYPQFQVYTVYIPYEYIYKPKEFLLQITHEIMHFCGEKIRLREVRNACFCCAVSNYIANEFQLESETVVEYLRKKMYSILVQETELSTPETKIFYLHDTVKRIKEWCGDNLRQNLFISNLISLYCEDKKKSANEVVNISDIYSSINNLLYLHNFTRYAQNIDDIAYLFKECYADFVTIYFLNIDIRIYIEQLINDVNIPDDYYNNHHKERVANVRAMIYQRAATVISALSDNGFKFYEDDIYYKHEMEISNLSILISKSDPSAADGKWKNAYYPYQTLCNIKDYLLACKEELNKVEASPSLSNLIRNQRKYYEILTKPSNDVNGMFSDDYYNLIYENRNRIDDLLESSQSQ